MPCLVYCTMTIASQNAADVSIASVTSQNQTSVPPAVVTPVFKPVIENNQPTTQATPVTPAQ